MNKNIAILSTVVNFGLYNKTAGLFPKGIPKYVIDGRNGMHGMDSLLYMHKILKGKGIEWLIMADEDVIFIDPELVHNCIAKMEAEGITVCGVRDGGVIPHRKYNPNVINTFFSIINFKEIEGIWDEKEIMSNQYTIGDEFNDDLSLIKGEYDKESTFEPYYRFYLWLRRKGKRFLFLEATVPFEEDQITNLVKDYQGNNMLYHTWYARSYDVSDKHTKRIDEILKKSLAVPELFTAPTLYKDKIYGPKKAVNKSFRKVWTKLKSLI